METKNPPNATDFVKKSSTRNKKRSFKRKFDRKQACSAPVCDDNAENIGPSRNIEMQSTNP